jgi:hypothetical protein
VVYSMPHCSHGSTVVSTTSALIVVVVVVVVVVSHHAGTLIVSHPCFVVINLY